MVIHLWHVKKYYGAELVLSDVSFEIGETEKVGLIGRNGTGKTTVLRLLDRASVPDEGELFIRKGATVGLLAQVPSAGDGATVYDALAEGFEQVRCWEREMKELEVKMSDPSVCADERAMQLLLNQYGQIMERFEQAGGYEMEASIRRVAAGMGIGAGQFGRPFASLSGGEKTKVGLAALLLKRPDILLLDEPTNHLDMAAIEWLETFLGSYPGVVVVVSHDRYFLDRVVGKIIEIEDGEAFVYHTDYSGYQKEKEERLLQQFADYQEQQKKIKKMQETIKQLIEWGNRANPPNPGFHRRAASMQKALDRMVKIKRPILERRAMDLTLTQEDRSGKQVILLDRVSKSFGERKLLRATSALLLYGERVALMGGNGAGKSTLMKMIIGGIPYDEGEIRLGSRVDIGYLAQEEAPPPDDSTVLRYFCDALAMEEGEARGELARFLFYGSDVFKRVSQLSGGEWSRLRLALLMYRKPNLLLLDEPTNHLDIDSREALEEALDSFPGTLLVISHDRYFMNRVVQKLWLLEQAELTVHLGNYEECREKLQALLQSSAAAAIPAEPERPQVDRKPAERKAGSKPPKPARRWEEEIAAAEERLRLLEEEMARLSASPAEEAECPKLLSEQSRLRQKLDELYREWMEAEESLD
ncbi:ATP-binding cassette domain-containing protein [Paenibacillus melissococcoides]|uniref:ATP-binding cassette domain-containing protein n=1 Tax=Paenibacillus melissococcoides TaxID=2912268 RepID=A0ABM9G1W4_9BACL|nr:ABC-F family ATP-binding cassette domain-containing protein [Paenibacillus melissococcoides]CAH8245306.1 ATP-binding cassette domain-containing protein [Paenibacillus melissococcoides]CAH8710582.1 ATP-binding cassette domain-containing protein [Paenibacillus melissococcoides]CAH8711352.1 ATP-binding cassette domain-containing protein [Paenibacillus melissococcoides]